MNSSGSKIPTFASPDAENLFLASKNGLRTYAELSLFSDFFLQFLIDFDHDLKKPVGFLASSSDELIFCIAACWQLGIPFICFNPKSTDQELQYQVRELEPGLIITDEEHHNYEFLDNRVNIAEVNLDRALSIDVELGRRAKTFKPKYKPEDIFGYFFTSGTTGSPKIVPLKRRQMLFAAEASSHNFKPRVNHFWLLCLPLNH
ncbi:MAG: class I adenylate-forming enzyme family protein, partial [Balneolaceae bacterium]|nr:class I adenylate-forming enzyme family protein [Balneolaceae bacterium]